MSTKKSESKLKAEGLLPTPSNTLYGTNSRGYIGPYARWYDGCLEVVCDRIRLESNVRAVQFELTTSSTEEIVFHHNAGVAPVAVMISSLSIPAGLTQDIKIEPVLIDDPNVVKMGVSPGDKGIGVGITVLFQLAGKRASA